MSKVEVLCPNGHRVSIKTTPNTKLLQILEEACTKKDFLPARDYTLRHGKKTLDLALTVRYAGLPNLAKLELVKSETVREEKDVVIALQLSSGERLQHEFSPSAALWDILVFWENKGDSSLKGRLACVTDDGQHPVIVYMREEVVGEYALKNTSLRKLGLTGGRAILRILHRAVDENTLKSIQDQIDKELARQSKLRATSRESDVSDTNVFKNSTKSAGLPATDNLESGESPSISVHSTKSMRGASQSSATGVPEDKDSSPASAMKLENRNEDKKGVEAMQEVQEDNERKSAGEQPMEVASKDNDMQPVEVVGKNDDMQPMEVASKDNDMQSVEIVREKDDMQPIEVASKDNEMQPMEVESGSKAKRKALESKTAGEARSQAASRASEHGAIQVAPGVQMFRPEDVPLTAEEQRIVEQAQAIAKVLMPSALPQQPDRAEMDRLRAERRAQIEWERAQQRRLRELLRAQPVAEFKFPEETKGQDLYKNEWSDVKREEYKPCERETVLYNMEQLPEVLQQSAHDDALSDEFFEVTENDVRTLWADAQRKIRDSQEQALMTKAMRLSQKEAQMSRYERVAVRVQFPDKLVLQGLFRPRETVHALYKYVTQHLEDPGEDFHLYTAPPKCVLTDKSSTLIEANLAPMSVVYFGSDKKEQCLKTPVLENQSSLLEANKVLVNYMKPKREEKASKVTSQRTKQSSTSSSASRGASGEMKTPKWFKLGKK